MRARGAVWFAIALGAVGIAFLPATKAQDQGQTSLATDVIDLTAEDSIEWLRDQKTYFARGNAVMRRNDQTYRADRLIAHYREVPGGGTEVWRFELHGNVSVESTDSTLTGDDAAYESDSEVFVVTGRRPHLVSKDMTLSADDSIEIWQAKDIAVARGNAVIVNEGRTLRGDVVVAYFVEGGLPTEEAAAAAKKQSDLDRFEAMGNVRIETEEQVLIADKAVYDPDADKALLSGSVKITSGQNQFNGELAEYNFTTEVGKILGGGSQRVHGLFKGQ